MTNITQSPDNHVVKLESHESCIGYLSNILVDLELPIVYLQFSIQICFFT